MTETRALAELRERMIGQRSGPFSVVDVRYEYLINEDLEEYLNVVLMLADPPPDPDDWPIEDIVQLRQRGRAEAYELAIAPPFFVTTSFGPDPDEWEEGSEE